MFRYFKNLESDQKWNQLLDPIPIRLTLIWYLPHYVMQCHAIGCNSHLKIPVNFYCSLATGIMVFCCLYTVRISFSDRFWLHRYYWVMCWQTVWCRWLWSIWPCWCVAAPIVGKSTWVSAGGRYDLNPYQLMWKQWQIAWLKLCSLLGRGCT